MIKFLRCTNPEFSHVKMAYGKLLAEWVSMKCECGYDFEGFIELFDDVFPDQLPAFENVDPDADTKSFPAVKVFDKLK